MGGLARRRGEGQRSCFPAAKKLNVHRRELPIEASKPDTEIGEIHEGDRNKERERRGTGKCIRLLGLLVDSLFTVSLLST